MTAASILLAAGIKPGVRRTCICCPEIRDSFPHVVQQKCPYFPADKRKLQVMILACVQFLVERYVCILVLNQWVYICFYCSVGLFYEGQIIFYRVSNFLRNTFLIKR